MNSQNEKEWTTYKNPDEPEAGIAMESRRWIEQENNHSKNQYKRMNNCRQWEEIRIQVTNDRQWPEHGEYRGNFYQMLIREMISRIQLENEDMVNSRRLPTVDVDTNQEEKQANQEGSSIKSEYEPPVVVMRLSEHSCDDDCDQEDSEGSWKEAYFESNPRRLEFIERRNS